MSKKLFALVSLLVLVSMLLAACAPQATEAPTEAATEAATEEATEAATEEATEAATEEATEAATEEPVAGVPAECESDEFGCAVIEAGTTVKIGMGAPMTGDNANFGIDISQGGQIAVEDTGEHEGFEFELVVEDDGGSPEGGAAVANRLVSDPTVVAIAGHIFSGATDAAMPIYEEKGLPMLSPSATNPALTQKGSAVFNRVAFTDAIQGQFAADYLFNTLGLTKIAVMHDGQAYGQGLAEVVRDEFTALGGEVVAFEAVTAGEADYSSPLAAVAAASPEALYYGGYIQEAVVLVNQMESAGLTDVVFFGCDGTFGSDFLERTGENGEGTYGTSLIPPESEAKTAFDATYEENFGVGSGTLSPYTWTGYDAVAALIHAVKSVAVVGGDGNLYIPRGALVAAVRGLTDYEGLTGTITCDETGECNSTGPTFYIIQGGEWVEAE